MPIFYSYCLINLNPIITFPVFIEEAKERYNHIKTELEIFDFPVAASPLGEKLIDNNDRYGNLRYVEYETLSDLTRANLWTAFRVSLHM